MQPNRAEPVQLTYEDYLRFPDDGRRHELIDGEHLVTPAPTSRHQEICVELIARIRTHLRGQPVGKLYTSPIDVVLSDRDVVQPDVLFVSNERREIVGDRVNGAPDLLVEIVSPSTRRADHVTKRHLYDRAGVREYWIVDPEIEVVKVYRRSDNGTFPKVAEPSREGGGVLETPLLPGFALPLTDLFEA